MLSLLTLSDKYSHKHNSAEALIIPYNLLFILVFYNHARPSKKKDSKKTVDSINLENTTSALYNELYDAAKTGLIWYSFKVSSKWSQFLIFVIASPNVSLIADSTYFPNRNRSIPIKWQINIFLNQELIRRIKNDSEWTNAVNNYIRKSKERIKKTLDGQARRDMNYYARFTLRNLVQAMPNRQLVGPSPLPRHPKGERFSVKSEKLITCLSQYEEFHNQIQSILKEDPEFENRVKAYHPEIANIVLKGYQVEEDASSKFSREAPPAYEMGPITTSTSTASRAEVTTEPTILTTTTTPTTTTNDTSTTISEPQATREQELMARIAELEGNNLELQRTLVKKEHQAKTQEHQIKMLNKAQAYSQGRFKALTQKFETLQKTNDQQATMIELQSLRTPPSTIEDPLANNIQSEDSKSKKEEVGMSERVTMSSFTVF